MNKGLLIWNIILTVLVVFLGIVTIVLRMAQQELVIQINEYNTVVEERILKDETLITEQFERFQSGIEKNRGLIIELTDVLNKNADAIDHNAEVFDEFRDFVNENAALIGENREYIIELQDAVINE